MKSIFFYILVLLHFTAYTQSVYYFSSSKGNDAYTQAQAQNQSTPWKSLDKLNALMPFLQPGYKVLLKRGDVFNGSVSITRSGNAARAIVLSAYGSGSKPVINGFTDVTSWKNVKANIWESSLNAGKRLNMLTVKGKIQFMGRYPNLHTSNGGYVPVSSHDTAGFSSGQPHNSSLTATSLPSSQIDWTGAEICVRPLRWMLNMHPIIQHSGNMIRYANAAYEPGDGFGFFIQNDERTLDEQGEWFYQPAQQKVRIWSAGNPAALQVKAAVTDTLVTILNRQYITIDNIAFQGANQFCIYTYKGSHITIQNCSFAYSGDNGINSDQTTSVLLDKDSIKDTNNNSIYVAPFAHNCTIRHCYVKNSGMVLGFGRSGNQAREAIVVSGDNSVVTYCVVDSIGYNGIVTANDSTLIKNNFVSNFNLLFDDGAGIYTSGRGKGRKILNNIIINGIGNHYGTNAGADLDGANGIGLDDLSEDVVIDGNSVANCSREGVGLHNAKNVQITNNTFYNIRDRSIGFLHDQQEPNNPIRNVTVKHNVFFATGVTDMLTRFDTRRDFADLTQFGNSDSNYWCRPFNPTSFFGFSYVNAAGSRVSETYDFSHWQTVFKQDLHSVNTPVRFPAYRFTSAGINKFPAGNFSKDAANVKSNQNNVTFSHDLKHLDNGCLQITANPAASSGGTVVTAWFIDFSRLETLHAGKTYRVRFSVQSQKEDQDIAVLIRGSNPAITEPQHAKASRKRSEVDMLFTPAQNIEHAWVELTIDRGSLPAWIDNFQLQEVNASGSRPADYFRFEYNASLTLRKISLGGSYVDVKGKLYRNTLELAPFSSAVLIRQNASAIK